MHHKAVLPLQEVAGADQRNTRLDVCSWLTPKNLEPHLPSTYVAQNCQRLQKLCHDIIPRGIFASMLMSGITLVRPRWVFLLRLVSVRT
jgi:hypothetical protein